MPKLRTHCCPCGLASVKSALLSIHLVDRCLMFLMLILLAQSAYNLFANELVSAETNSIDVVVRTTAAAIFGYFLSTNFTKCADEIGPKSPAAPAPPAATQERGTPHAQAAPRMAQAHAIGFAPAEEPTPTLADGRVASDRETWTFGSGDSSRQQIVIATLIGAFSLVILLLARNMGTLTPAMLGTLSQLRDFVAGAVGFLIGSPCAMKVQHGRNP